MTAEERIAKALEMAEYGGFDGSHHKMWAIDQIVRALTGCPIVIRTAKDCRGNPYEYETQGESEEYLEWVRAMCDGADGPNTYEWDEGIAP